VGGARRGGRTCSQCGGVNSRIALNKAVGDSLTNIYIFLIGEVAGESGKGLPRFVI